MLPMMGHLSDNIAPRLLQPVMIPDAGLWHDLERYVAKRRVTLEQFRRRHRLDRAFLAKLQAGIVPDTDPGAARVRRIVAFGPDVRRRRKALGVKLRTLAINAEMTPSRLSRAERLLAEFTPSEKRKINRCFADIEKRRDRERQAAHCRQLAVWLRTSRSNSGLTQAQLAKAIGCERKAVIRWEKSGVIPTWWLTSLQSVLTVLPPLAEQKGY